jgi:hypothetical protein
LLTLVYTVFNFYASGLQFENGKYAIILSNSYPAEAIGEIKVSNPPAGVIYTLSTPSTILAIDRNSGKLNLLVEIDLQHNNSKFNISARKANDAAFTEVKLFVLPLNHGDTFALDAVKSVRKRLDKKITAPTIFIPAILDVILQQLAAGYPANNTSKAEEIVTMAITVVKSAVIHVYGRVPGNIVIIIICMLK